MSKLRLKIAFAQSSVQFKNYVKTIINNVRNKQ